eukprot:489081_1
MIDFYGEMEDINKAMHIFNTMNLENRHNICTMSVMMNAYCNNEMNKECMDLYKYIIDNGIKPNHITVATVLKAATHESALCFTNDIYEYFKLYDYNNEILKSLHVQLNLIGLYGKCNKLYICQQIFDDIKHGESVKYKTEIKIWNAMMNAFARNGNTKKVMEIFDIMNKDTNLIANGRTYCILLNACNYSKNIELFNYILNEYIIKNENDLKYMNMDDMSRKELLCILDLFILCFQMKKHMTE